ncbi:MAG: hypothetical protein QOE66_36 [Chloroflexota bacterium]|jgi:hypothetical protein|nr:hypothetical protein [Chloroflexota bacterium]
MGILLGRPTAIIGIDPATPIRSRSTTLDDPKANSTPPPPPRGPRKAPPGLGAQIRATKDAVVALVVAHIDLAKAEAGAIAGNVGRLAALVALAFGLVIIAIFLLVIGSALFAGEWLLGSIGWGVLHGFLLFIAMAIAAVLVGLGVPVVRIGRAMLVGVVVAIVVGLLFGFDLPNRLWTAIGDGVGLGVEPGTRPLVVGLLIGGVIGLVAGIVVALRAAGGPARLAGLVALVVLGLALGAFTAITFGYRVGAGIGITAGYLTWIGLMGVGVVRNGVDVDALKKRFYPSQTIDTTKETLEWLQKRMPPGIGS